MHGGGYKMAGRDQRRMISGSLDSIWLKGAKVNGPHTRTA